MRQLKTNYLNETVIDKVILHNIVLDRNSWQDNSIQDIRHNCRHGTSREDNSGRENYRQAILDKTIFI